MFTTYNLFKFLHIVAAMIWIGGLVAVSVLNARLAREGDGTVRAAMARQGRFFGMAVAGPAAVITLIAGIVMLAVSGMGAQLWVMWGFAAIVLSLVIGATFLRRTAEALNERLATAGHDDPQVASLQRRLAILNSLNVLLLLSAVWAMVFKPTL